VSESKAPENATQRPSFPLNEAMCITIPFYGDIDAGEQKKLN